MTSGECGLIGKGDDRKEKNRERSGGGDIGSVLRHRTEHRKFKTTYSKLSRGGCGGKETPAGKGLYVNLSSSDGRESPK